MTNEASGEQGMGWLLEPAPAGEARIHIDVGESATLTPEVQDALERLASALQAGQEDVQGFFLSLMAVCNPRTVVCSPQTEGGCYTYMTCRIIKNPG